MGVPPSAVFEKAFPSCQRNVGTVFPQTSFPRQSVLPSLICRMIGDLPASTELFWEEQIGDQELPPQSLVPVMSNDGAERVLS